MSKYIIEVGEGYIRHGLERTLAIPVRINEHEDHWMDTRIPVTPYTEPDTNEAYQRGYEEGYAVGEAKKNSVEDEAYQRGLNDAKEGKATCQYCEYQYLDDTEEPCKKCCKAYMNKFKPKAKEEPIQVGDEVKDDKDDIGICTEISYSANSMHIMYADGTATDISLTGVTKTGRHYLQIAEVLRKMRGEQDG